MHYGLLTNFQSKGSGKEDLLWRIFYKDANNIYLISSVKQNNVEQVSLTSHLLETSNSISNLGKALNPLYTATANSWSMNLSKEQTVAYLLDSTIWDDYTDQSGKATWAIGGPPVEMYANSLKQTFPTLIDTVWAEPGYGYRYSGTIASSPCIKTNLKKGIYGGGNLNYVISSPCGSWGSNDRICGLNNSNNLGYFWNQESFKWAGCDPSSSNNWGVRPIVCIPINKFNYTIYNYQ